MRWTDQQVRLPSSPWHLAKQNFQVQLAASAIEAARRHLGNSPFEQGGLLLGRLFHDAGQGSDKPLRIIAVSVDAVVPAIDGIGTEVSLSIPSSVWNAAAKHKSSEQVIVGWYHSHPDIGAFFSATDRQTQAAFFTQAWSLGWVIDPVRAEQAWFYGAKSQALHADQLQVVSGSENSSL